MENFSLLYKSLKRARSYAHGYDSETRDLTITQEFFKLANIPFDTIPAIAITGSKGKGSTSILASAIIERSGKKVGLVTSPHLVDFCERIRINGRMIGENNFLGILNEFAPIINKIDSDLPKNKFLGPTGIILACAITYFMKNEVDLIVLEAGRGGRFDETNLIPNLATCLTPIMNEHLDKLGPTTLDVAWNKVGLIKPYSTVISATQPEEIEKIVIDEAVSKKASLLRVGKEILFNSKATSNDIQEIYIQIPSMNFQENIQIKSKGLYQGMNLAVATGAAISTGYLNSNSKKDLTSSLLNLRLPGRCEVISETPTVILDGAINRQAALEFKRSISTTRHPLVLITALPEDKDAEGLLAELAPLVDNVIITTANSPILSFTNNVSIIAKSYSKNFIETSKSNEAFKIALSEAGADGMIWIVGTQSLIRDALIYWKQRVDSFWVEVNR